MKKTAPGITGTKGEFIKRFNRMCVAQGPWQVWGDIISMMACSISNAVDKSPKHWKPREKEYMDAEKRIPGGAQAVGELFTIMVEALDRNPEQDFLGEMFMELGLGDNWKGQFFTPYSVCDMMARTTLDPKMIEQKIADQGWISCNDPACGAGATLIAAANVMRKVGKINYQQKALFVANDVDRLAAQMCYIQLSMLGCAGYVGIANTLTNPLSGGTLLNPVEKAGQEIWYTPMFFGDNWAVRRELELIRLMTGKHKPKEEQKRMFFFEFPGKEAAKCPT